MAGCGNESVSSGSLSSGGEALRLCEGVGSAELAGVVLLERDWWLRRRPPGGGGRDVGLAEFGSMAEWCGGREKAMWESIEDDPTQLDTLSSLA